jgi:hypothetical protein
MSTAYPAKLAQISLTLQGGGKRRGALSTVTKWTLGMAATRSRNLWFISRWSTSPAASLWRGSFLLREAASGHRKSQTDIFDDLT